MSNITWYAAQPSHMAGSAAAARQVTLSACDAGFGLGVQVRKHTNPTIGRPTGSGGGASG